MQLRGDVLALAWMLAFPLLVRAQAPTLSHSAPKLGNVLSVDLSGAPPGAAVRLFHSPGEASTTTPFGTLELSRSGLTLVASGLSDPQGRFGYQQSLPLDPVLAETWGHYQALVEDSSAPAGWVLSQAVHLRYVGTRLYLTSWGVPWFPQGELNVLSAIDDSCIATLLLSAGQSLSWAFHTGDPDRGTPVFSADLSLGALVPTSDRLVVFDNFQLAVLATLPLVEADCALVPGLDGRSVVVLDRPSATLLWVDLPTATVTDRLALPWAVQGPLAATPDGRRAWVGEAMPGAKRPSLRQVDLVSRRVLAAVQIGAPDGCELRDVRATPDVLYATAFYSDPFNPYGTIGSLSAVDLTGSPPTVRTLQSPLYPSLLRPLTEAGLLVSSWSSTLGPGSDMLFLCSLSPVPALRKLVVPDAYYGDFNLQEVRWGGNDLWLLDHCYGYDGGPGLLLSCSLPAQQWAPGGAWSSGGPRAVEVVRDGLVHKVYVAQDGELSPVHAPPRLHVLDLATGSRRSQAGPWAPASMRALTVP